MHIHIVSIAKRLLPFSKKISWYLEHDRVYERNPESGSQIVWNKVRNHKQNQARFHNPRPIKKWARDVAQTNCARLSSHLIFYNWVFQLLRCFIILFSKRIESFINKCFAIQNKNSSIGEENPKILEIQPMYAYPFTWSISFT